MVAKIKNMFSYPDIDLKISVALLIVSFISGLITWGISKKWFLAIIIFSILGNLSFLGNIGSLMFDFYQINWLKYLSVFIWPFINVALIIIYRKQKNENKNN